MVYVSRSSQALRSVMHSALHNACAAGAVLLLCCTIMACGSADVASLGARESAQPAVTAPPQPGSDSMFSAALEGPARQPEAHPAASPQAPRGEAGAAAPGPGEGAGSEAPVPVMTMPEPSTPEPNSAALAQGTWLIEAAGDVQVTKDDGSIDEVIEVSITVRADVGPNEAGEMRLVATVCDVVQEPLMGYTLMPPPAYWAHYPRSETPIDLSAMTLDTAHLVLDYGWEPATSSSDEDLPTSEADPRVVDMDMDGQPGVTTFLDGALPTDSYVVQRTTTEISAAPVSERRLEGMMSLHMQTVTLRAADRLVSSFVEGLLEARSVGAGLPTAATHLDDTSAAGCAGLR